MRTNLAERLGYEPEEETRERQERLLEELRYRELPPCYGGGCLLSGDRLALALTDGSVLILNPDGSTAMTFPASALEPYLGEGFTWQWDGGPSLDWVDDVGRVWKYDENDPEGSRYACWLNPDTGAVTMAPPPSFPVTGSVRVSQSL